MSLYYDSGVLVKLYVREQMSDAVTAFVAHRGEAITINGMHELEIWNALRLSGASCANPAPGATVSEPAEPIR